jgi:thioredoxin-like negative regulator of GroEL
LTVQNVTSYTEWKSIVDTGSPVVVDFHGEAWCAPCRAFSPTFTKTAEARPDVTFVKVDVDVADPEFLNDFSFQSVPSVFVVKDGETTPIKHGTGPAFLRKVNEHVPEGNPS